MQKKVAFDGLVLIGSLGEVYLGCGGVGDPSLRGSRISEKLGETQRWFS